MTREKLIKELRSRLAGNVSSWAGGAWILPGWAEDLLEYIDDEIQEIEEDAWGKGADAVDPNWNLRQQ